MGENEKQSKSKLGVPALICSILGCTLFIGIILAIIDLCKKDGTDKKLSKISLIICGVWIVLAFAFGGNSDNNNSEKSETPTSIVTESNTEQIETENKSEDVVSEPAEETVPEPVEEAEPSMTLGQKNALGKANSYLNYTSFSYSGLIKQLEFEGYSNEDATFAVDNCGADWNEQAAKKAESYLSYSNFSKDELIKQLEFEGFTTDQAKYGVSAVGY